MKAFLRQAIAPLGVFAFWGGVLMAAWRYPSEYDWRYMTLSSLLSPYRDAPGHLWASGGILLCGLCGFCWAAVLVRGAQPTGTGERPTGIWLLRLGNFFMMGSAVLPSRLLRVPKGHEIIVLLAFVFLCVGMMSLTFQTVERNFLRRTHRGCGRPRLYAAALAIGAVLPILLAGSIEAYVFYGRPELHWVSLAWRARGIPMFLSFAFWEWITCVVLSVYMATLPLLATRALQHVRNTA